MFLSILRLPNRDLICPQGLKPSSVVSIIKFTSFKADYLKQLSSDEMHCFKTVKKEDVHEFPVIAYDFIFTERLCHLANCRVFPVSWLWMPHLMCYARRFGKTIQVWGGTKIIERIIWAKSLGIRALQKNSGLHMTKTNTIWYVDTSEEITILYWALIDVLQQGAPTWHPISI